MATTKKITNLEALTICAYVPADVIAQYIPDDMEYTGEQVSGKLSIMRDSEKKRADNRKNAPKTPSKETLENERKARKAARIIAEQDGPVTLNWLVEHLDWLYTVSGASGCMRTAKKLGLVKNTDRQKVGKKLVAAYSATDAGLALLESED